MFSCTFRRVRKCTKRRAKVRSCLEALCPPDPGCRECNILPLAVLPRWAEPRIRPYEFSVAAIPRNMRQMGPEQARNSTGRVFWRMTQLAHPRRSPPEGEDIDYGRLFPCSDVLRRVYTHVTLTGFESGGYIFNACQASPPRGTHGCTLSGRAAPPCCS